MQIVRTIIQVLVYDGSCIILNEKGLVVLETVSEEWW